MKTSSTVEEAKSMNYKSRQLQKSARVAEHGRRRCIINWNCNFFNVSMSLTVTRITREELKLTWRGKLERDEVKWIGGMTKAAVKFLLIMRSKNGKGVALHDDDVEMLWKVSTKDLQNGANAAMFSLLLLFCARNDFFMSIIEAENALEELSKFWWKWNANSDNSRRQFWHCKTVKLPRREKF